MANTYTWTINSMDTVPNLDGNKNFVVTVHWTCTGTDGKNTRSLAGAAGFAPKEGKTYENYSSLTQDQVISWVHDFLGDERMAEVEADITSQLSMVAAPQPLPW